jgi:ubiquitin carboxyl-terminal hydrolase 4/11/15
VKDYVKMDCKAEGVNTIYDLYAVTNHFGSLNGGHYTANGRNPDGNWYNFNDSKVSECGEKNLCASSAYLLFYRRREDPSPESKATGEETKASSENRRSEKSNDSGKYIYELD